MNKMQLSGKQARFLRALGHHLEPVVQVGKHGLTDSARDAVGVALSRHELVKVRVGTECPVDRREVADGLAQALTASVAQVLGRTILLYRRHPTEPKIVLPDDRAKATHRAAGRDDGAGTRGHPSELVARANEAQGSGAASATGEEGATERPAKGARSRKSAGTPKPSAARTAERKAARAAEAQAQIEGFAERGRGPRTPSEPAGRRARGGASKTSTNKGGLSHGRPARGRWSDGTPMGGPKRRPGRRADETPWSRDDSSEGSGSRTPTRSGPGKPANTTRPTRSAAGRSSTGRAGIGKAGVPSAGRKR